MNVSELTQWLRTRGVAEMRGVLDELEGDFRCRHGKAMTNLYRLSLIQLRLAEEVRALNHPDLAGALVAWLQQPIVRSILYLHFRGEESPESFLRALPQMLDEVARNVIEKQNRLHSLESVLDEEEGEEGEDHP